MPTDNNIQQQQQWMSAPRVKMNPIFNTQSLKNWIWALLPPTRKRLQIRAESGCLFLKNLWLCPCHVFLKPSKPSAAVSRLAESTFLPSCWTEGRQIVTVTHYCHWRHKWYYEKEHSRYLCNIILKCLWHNVLAVLFCWW